MAMSQDGIDIPSPSVFLRPSSVSPEDRPARPQHVRKPSKTKSANVHPTAATTGSALKPKQSKSRNGCSTCKAKRLKCDEEKPGCQQCAKRKVECGGYKKDFKWRPFEESNVKVTIDRQKKVTSPTQHARPTSEESSPHDQLPALTPPEPSRAKARRIERVPKNNVVENDIPAVPSDHGDEADVPFATGDEQAAITLTTGSRPSSGPIYGSGSLSSQQCANGASPTFTELLQPFPEPSPDDDGFVLFQMPDDFDLPFVSDFEFDPLAISPLESDDAEEIGRDINSLDRSVWTHRTRGMPGTIDYLYCEPSLAPDSAEMLCLRFDKLTCGILSVMDGPTENPWRSLIWPLAQQSPALYHAVTAMTAYHSSTDVPALRLAGHEHKQASIRYIQEGIRDNSMSDQTAIATALALGFAESWDQHTASGNTHIKGAQALVKRVLAEHRENPLQGEELARLKFLCNAWVYMDVIARLTAVDSDESNDFDNAFLFSTDAHSPVLDTQSGFGIDFGIPIDARLDPLMGCASTLFPLIGRVANLVKKIFRSRSNSPAAISQANDLKLLLETWEPPDFIEPPEDPTSQVQHSLQTAEAYRWATLLHLHQSIPELPSSSSAELGQKVLTYLATVPLASRTVIVQIYPLMVAGCEAVTQEDRQWVRDRWAAMHARMRIGVVEKCSTVTEEVWQRRDVYEAQPAQHRKLIATADLQLRRSGPGRLKRSHTSFQSTAIDRDGVEDTTLLNGHRPRSSRGSHGGSIGAMDPAYTVRGHLNWVSVMSEWEWEVLLG